MDVQPLRAVRPFALWPSVGLFVLAAVGPIIPLGLLMSLTLAIEALVRHPRSAHATSEIARAAPASLTSQSFEALYYAAMCALLVMSLPKVAHTTLAGLGFARAGLRDWRGLGVGVLLGLVIQAASPFYFAAIHQSDHVQAGFENFTPANAAEWTAALVIIALIAPIVEELLFRGLLFRAMWSRWPLAVSALVSGVVFGAIHCDPVVFPVIALLGTTGAVLYARTNNLWAAIALHATNNCYGVAGDLAQWLHHHPA